MSDFRTHIGKILGVGPAAAQRLIEDAKEDLGLRSARGMNACRVEEYLAQLKNVHLEAVGRWNNCGESSLHGQNTGSDAKRAPSGQSPSTFKSAPKGTPTHGLVPSATDRNHLMVIDLSKPSVMMICHLIDRLQNRGHGSNDSIIQVRDYCNNTLNPEETEYE